MAVAASAGTARQERSGPMEQTSSESKIRRIVIIGAVAAGTSAAAKARRNDEQAEIILYERDRFISYSGCGLPYFIGGSVARIEELTPRDPAFFKGKYNVDVLIRHEVMSIDPATKSLVVRDLDSERIFTDHYDTLILATGASSVRPQFSGMDRKHVFTLRSPDDAIAIRSYIDQNNPTAAVVIGSGFIGLEMVENLVRAGMKVTLIEKLPQVCPFLDPDMAPRLEQYLVKQGVAVLTGRTAASIEEQTVVCDDGRRIPADLVLVAVGIRPNTRLASAAGVKLGHTGAIAVDRSMRTNIPDLYACGDCAESYSVVDGRPLYRPLGSTANKQGRITGDVITGGTLQHRGIAGTGIFQVFEMGIAATGLTEKEARESGYDVVVNHNIKPDKPVYFGGREMVIKSIADRRTEKLLGVQIVGFGGVDKRIDVFVVAMTAGLKVSDLFHLDLAYAPPYATTKDPVHYTGMILDNAINRGRDLITADELTRIQDEQGSDSIQVIDTRVAKQYAQGHAREAINLPHAVLREKINELDPEKPVVTYCNKGVTGNAVQNILINRGFKKVYCLSGGYNQYKAGRPTRETDPQQSGDNGM